VVSSLQVFRPDLPGVYQVGQTHHNCASLNLQPRFGVKQNFGVTRFVISTLGGIIIFIECVDFWDKGRREQTVKTLCSPPPAETICDYVPNLEVLMSRQLLSSRSVIRLLTARPLGVMGLTELTDTIVVSPGAFMARPWRTRAHSCIGIYDTLYM
jgi:hypothetical protein